MLHFVMIDIYFCELNYKIFPCPHGRRFVRIVACRGGMPRLFVYLLVASNKVVAGSTGMGDEAVQVALRVKDDTVGTGRAARVDLVGGEDGVFVPRASGREVEALAVVVLVGVAVFEGVSMLKIPGKLLNGRTLGLAVLEIRETLLDSSVDIGLPVADAAAAVDARRTLSGRSGDGSDEREGSSDDLQTRGC